MFDFYLTIAFSILNIVVPYGIVRYDRSRLRAEQLARAWNRPSFACAVYFFGPLCLPAHFWITRRRPAALGVGALLSIAVFGGEWVLGSILEQMLA